MGDLSNTWDDARGRRRIKTLTLLGDLWVPSLPAPENATAEVAAFFARSASELDVASAVARYLDEHVKAEDRAGLLKLLDLMALLAPRIGGPAMRERWLARVRGFNTDIAVGLDALRAITLLHFYAHIGDDGANRNWPAIGYPGPPPATLPATPRLRTHTLNTDTLEADVCVVGSGAGGGVIAAGLAQAGLNVVVLEAGAHREEVDFQPYELASLRDLYWRGGYVATQERSVSVVAGATLGGGTVVNWMNCVQPPDFVRSQWAEFGLKGLDSAEFDRHLEAVSARISANTACSDRNGPNERLAEGAEALGWAWHIAARNADADAYDPANAGHMGFGDRSGSKQSTLRTYLRDAVAAGARIVPGARVTRVLTEGGRAAGVEATVQSSDGSQATVQVRAATVVLACGALETPALLLRSGIGGPAVGKHLRLHPVNALLGRYADAQQSWWGAPQTVIADQWRDLGDGYGFLLETPHFGTGVSAASLPWISGRTHKELIAQSANFATFIGVVRDRGEGSVSVDAQGEAVVSYPLDDEVDLKNLQQSLEAMARAHAAAGALEIMDIHPSLPRWSQGDDLEAFIARIRQLPMGAGRGGRPLFSAHQMGTARMGSDPATSVADPEGQLHDTAGVWIGDTSAFPTAVGSNPMLTCMALAHRTAEAITAARAPS